MIKITLEINMKEKTIKEFGANTEFFKDVLSDENMSFEEIVKEFNEKLKKSDEIITYLKV